MAGRPLTPLSYAIGDRRGGRGGETRREDGGDPSAAAGRRSVGTEHRRVAILIARARVGLGAAMVVLGGPVATLAVGSRERGGRAALRLAGGRDVALGLGALTCLHERTQDAEWVSMGALVDGVDALVLFATPGLPRRSRLVGCLAAGCAVAGLLASWRLADERTERVALG